MDITVSKRSSNSREQVRPCQRERREVTEPSVYLQKPHQPCCFPPAASTPHAARQQPTQPAPPRGGPRSSPRRLRCVRPGLSARGWRGLPRWVHGDLTTSQAWARVQTQAGRPPLPCLLSSFP